jgi:hypothetical protein
MASASRTSVGLVFSGADGDWTDLSPLGDHGGPDPASERHLPLIMILFGIGETSKIVVVLIAAFFPMLINTMAGVRQIQPLYFEVAANYGARPVQVFACVIIVHNLLCG